MAYTDEGKIENYLMTDIDNSLSSQISDWISAAELFINNYTGRKDGFESASSTKYFDGSGTSILNVDDFTSITSVQILELDSTSVEYTLTEGRANDYITLPINETPKYTLQLMPGSSVGAFYSGVGRIKITAAWGTKSSVPKDIELAATILVAEIVKQGRDGGLVTTEALGDYSSSFEVFTDMTFRITNVKRILDRYKIIEL